MIGHPKFIHEYICDYAVICLAILVEKLPAIIELLWNVLVLLFLCCFVWIHIFMTAFNVVIQRCVQYLRMFNRTSSGIGSVFCMRLRDWMSDGNAPTSTIYRRLPNASVEQHPLRERWFDGY